MKNLDLAAELGDYDTITRPQWRRIRNLCQECGSPLKPHQIERGGRFCTPRCSGRNVARREYGPEVVPLHPGTPQEAQVGIVHDLIGGEYDPVTGERNDYPLPDRCEGCGGPYRRKRKDQRYCSPACRASNRANNGHPPRARPAKRRPLEPVPVTTVTAGPAVDLGALLNQILAVAGEWHLEARIADIHLTLTRPAP